VNKEKKRKRENLNKQEILKEDAVFPYVSQESSLPLIFLYIALICLAVRTRDDYLDDHFSQFIKFS